MEDYRRRAAVRMCEYFRRGLFTAEEVCRKVLFFCVEPTHAAEYLGLLPDDLRATLAEFLPTLPTSDRGWAEFQGVGQLDGDEWSWARTVAECRANTEAVRARLLGEASPPSAADFMDRVRAGYRARLDEFRPKLELQQQRHAEPGDVADGGA